MPVAPKDKAVVLLRWCLGAHLVFGSLLVYGVNQKDRIETDAAKQWALQREVDRMFLDPKAPAISLADRRRVVRLLFPEMPEANVVRYTGTK